MSENVSGRVYDAEVVVGDDGVAVLIPEAGYKPTSWHMTNGRLDIAEENGKVIAAVPISPAGVRILEQQSDLRCISVDIHGPYRPFTLKPEPNATENV